MIEILFAGLLATASTPAATLAAQETATDRR